MASYIGKALLMDGDTLFGVSCQSSGDVFSEDASFAFAQWSMVGGDVASSEGNGISSRATAFSSAIGEFGIDDGAPLALPPELLVTRVLTLPATDPESLASMIRLEMEKFAPVADEELEVDYEAISATENDTRVFAVAVPIATLDDLAEDLESSGLAVTRIDSALLCEWHSIEGIGNGENEPGKRLWLLAMPSGRWDFFAADETGPIFARTLGKPATPEDLAREITLSLLDLAAEQPGFSASAFFTALPQGMDAAFIKAASTAAGLQAEIIDAASLTPFVRSALEREETDGCIDIVPAAWRADEQASRTRRKFIGGAIAAVAVWAILYGVLMALPQLAKRQTAAIRREISAIMPRYTEVADIRTRVRLIESYEDRSRSAIELLRLICEGMPQDIVFSSFNYDVPDDPSSAKAKKDPGGIKIVGDAAASDSVLQFKDAIDGLALFRPARMTGPNLDGKRSRYKFELDWRFAEDATWQ